MGGTPWKSNGCNTCKRRKVKCDFQRPHCARCLRGGFRCEGYNRTRRFIHTFSQADDPKEQIVQPKAAESSAPLTVINVNSQIRSQLFSLFIDSYMPSCPSGQIAYRCQPAPNLVPLLPALMNGSNHQLLDRATSALASVFVGKKFGNAQLTTHGMQLYNHAIHMFLRILPQDGLPIQEVLCANMIFQLYEVINCSSGFTAWTAHMQGANAVLARHHNALPRDHLSTMLIRHLKLSNIFHAIGKQKRALFFCPTVLDLSDSLPKNDFIDDIIDILLTCTELIEHMAQVQSVNYAAKLIECCLNVKQQADSWEERLQAQHENALFTTTTAKTNTSPSISSTALFSESYQFAAPEIAEAYMLYWSALLVIFSVLHGAELWRLSDLNGSAEQKMAYQQRAALFSRNAEFHANQICRGVGYFIQPDMHILGGHSVLFPMAMTSQFFHRNGLKSRFEWCQEVFASLEKIGLGLAHIIQGTPWDRYQVGEAEIATDNSRN